MEIRHASFKTPDFVQLLRDHDMCAPSSSPTPPANGLRRRPHLRLRLRPASTATNNSTSAATPPKPSTNAPPASKPGPKAPNSPPPERLPPSPPKNANPATSTSTSTTTSKSAPPSTPSPSPNASRRLPPRRTARCPPGQPQSRRPRLLADREIPAMKSPNPVAQTTNCLCGRPLISQSRRHFKKSRRWHRRNVLSPKNPHPNI